MMFLGVGSFIHRDMTEHHKLQNMVKYEGEGLVAVVACIEADLGEGDMVLDASLHQHLLDKIIITLHYQETESPTTMSGLGTECTGLAVEVTKKQSPVPV